MNRDHEIDDLNPVNVVSLVLLLGAATFISMGVGALYGLATGFLTLGGAALGLSLAIKVSHGRSTRR